MQTDLLAENIRKRFDHAQARLVLKEKYATKMIFTHKEGMWRAGPELLVACNICIANGYDNPVLEDIYGNPIQVDAQDLKTLAMQRWQEQMNGWLVEYDQLGTQR